MDVDTATLTLSSDGDSIDGDCDCSHNGGDSNGIGDFKYIGGDSINDDESSFRSIHLPIRSSYTIYINLFHQTFRRLKGEYRSYRRIHSPKYSEFSGQV